MATEKRYYWLKLQDGFFGSKRIKKLRKIAGGDTYTIIYLKMQLLAMKNGGFLEYTGLEDTFAEELALDLDENADNVSVTINYLLSCGLLETTNNREFYVPYAVENTGSEGTSTKRVREYRERKALQCNADVTPAKQIGNGEIEKEKESESEIEKEEKIEDLSLGGDETPPPPPNPPSPSQSEKSTSPAVIHILLNDGSEYPVTQEDVDHWKNLYQAVDIMQQLRKMKGWAEANPKKRKTKNGIKRFINSWLAGEQDKYHGHEGGGTGGLNGTHAPPQRRGTYV